jgi:hypothetical protein
VRIPAFAALLALASCSIHGTGTPRLSMDGRVRCTNDIGLPIFDTVVGVGALTMAGFVYAGSDVSESSRASRSSLTTSFVLLGALAVGSAVYGYRKVSECNRAKAIEREERTAAVAARKEHKRAQGLAWIATQRAQVAARAGDCATVDKLDREVRDLDEEFHAAVFKQDVAIARCLAKD